MISNEKQCDEADSGTIPVQVRFIPIDEVLNLTSLSRASVLRGVNRRTFPAPVRLTPTGRRVAWRHADVALWLQDPIGWETPR